MNVELRPLAEIRPYEKNPRINDAAVDAVAESIRQFGFRQPVVVDGDGMIVVGHTRWKAAKKLGMEEVAVHVAKDLSPEQARAYRIADNKTADLAEWDLELLPIELAELQAMDIDLSLLGFDEDELAKLLGSGVEQGLTDPDEIPEPPDEAVTKPGDLIILGDHRLLCGDSGNGDDVDRLLDGAAIHLVSTDPPHNVKVEPRSNNAIAAGLSSFQAANARRGATGGTFLVEGLNLTSQALTARAPVQSVFLRDPVEDDAVALLESAGAAGVDCHVVTKGVFFRILGLGYETSARVLASVRAEPVSPAQTVSSVDAGSCLLVGESIQDPRNVGVLVRNADACGATAAVFTSDSANPYSRESVRSSTGSVFRMPLTLTDDLAGFLEELKRRSVAIVGTSAQADTPCWDIEVSRPCAIVVGNETDGLSDRTRDLCDVLVAIPISGGAHSFNVTVAAGIVLYEVSRQAAERERNGDGG